MAASRPLSLLSPGQRLAAPAHSYDHYEERSMASTECLPGLSTENKSTSVRGRCIPRGAVHRIDNDGSRDMKALCAITPAAIGPQYFRESVEVIDAAAGGPPDRTGMADIMRAAASRRLRLRLRRRDRGTSEHNQHIQIGTVAR